MKLRILALSIITLVASFSHALSSEDKAFVKAVKNKNLDVVERLFPVVSKRAYDTALRAAARKGHIDLFNRIAPCASPRGYQKAVRSLCKRGFAHIHHVVHVFGPQQEVNAKK